MDVTKELEVTLEDRPGTLAKAADAIASAGINIDGFCAVPFGKEGKGAFHVLTSDPASAKRALQNAGFKVTEERDVAIIDAEDRPGYLAELLRKVAQNELNLGPTYSITGDRIAMTANDFDKLRDVVRQAVPTTTRR